MNTSQGQAHEMEIKQNIFTCKNCFQDNWVCAECSQESNNDQSLKQSQSYNIDEKFSQNILLDLQTQLQINHQQDSIQLIDDEHTINQDGQLKFYNYHRYSSDKILCSAQISENEKYLGCGGMNNKIKIYYLKIKKLIKSIKLDSFVKIIKFTDGSRYILSGDSIGNLYCNDIANNYKFCYNNKVHSDSILNLITIDDEQILTYTKKSVSIINLKLNQQLFKIENAPGDFIRGIDYDKSNDFIISCSANNSIKFFKRKDYKLEFQYKIEIQVDQIHLIQKSNILISYDYFQLTLWQIDYEGLLMIKIKKVDLFIINLTSVLNNSKLVVVCEENVSILDNDLSEIQSINHHIKEFYCTQQYQFHFYLVFFQATQLNSLKYIIVPGKNKLQILKRRRI